MKRILTISLFAGIIGSLGFNCDKKTSGPALPADTSYVNLSHLNHLYVPVSFPGVSNAAGIFIYAEAPDYHLVEAAGEGYTCVDDVARAVLVYLRSTGFNTDTALQNKAFSLIRFTLEMQAPSGYFYNFVYTNGLINKFGITSADNANWWSWRALQALTEASPIVRSKDAQLANKMDVAVNNLVTKIKTDLVNIPATTHINNGVVVPEWLPAGSGTDQAALMILGLIPYSTATNDPIISAYIRKLADAIMLMQNGGPGQFPYGSILSWENTWHAYGSDQAWALLKAGAFLNDTSITNKALTEINNFYPWLIQDGYKSSFVIQGNGVTYQMESKNDYEQIAYGIRPMVSAAIEAYVLTGQANYADMAGHLAAWFLGANVMNTYMYDKTTGRCFDAIASASNINRNSGAESTIEALLTFQLVEKYPAVKEALERYKR